MEQVWGGAGGGRGKDSKVLTQRYHRPVNLVTKRRRKSQQRRNHAARRNDMAGDKSPVLLVQVDDGKVEGWQSR